MDIVALGTNIAELQGAGRICSELRNDLRNDVRVGFPVANGVEEPSYPYLCLRIPGCKGRDLFARGFRNAVNVQRVGELRFLMRMVGNAVDGCCRGEEETFYPVGAACIGHVLSAQQIRVNCFNWVLVAIRNVVMSGQMIDMMWAKAIKDLPECLSVPNIRLVQLDSAFQMPDVLKTCLMKKNIDR